MAVAGCSVEGRLSYVIVADCLAEEDMDLLVAGRYGSSVSGCLAEEDMDLRIVAGRYGSSVSVGADIMVSVSLELIRLLWDVESVRQFLLR